MQEADQELVGALSMDTLLRLAGANFTRIYRNGSIPQISFTVLRRLTFRFGRQVFDDLSDFYRLSWSRVISLVAALAMISTVVVAALPIPVTAFGALPTFADQKTVLATYHFSFLFSNPGIYLLPAAYVS